MTSNERSSKTDGDNSPVGDFDEHRLSLDQSQPEDEESDSEKPDPNNVDYPNDYDYYKREKSEIQHGPFEWTVNKRFKDFYSLNNHFLAYRAGHAVASPFRKLRRGRSTRHNRPSVILPYDLIDGLVIEGKKPAESSVVEPPDEVVLERRPTRPRLNLSETEDMSSLSPSEEKDEKLSKFPTLPDSMIGEDNVEHRRAVFEAYLNRLLSIPGFLDDEEMLEFLEVSHLSFVTDLGAKRKEGPIIKYQGGHHAEVSCVGNFSSCCATCSRKWQSRWLLIKDSYVAYIIPHTNTVRELLLFDSDFEVKTEGYELGGLRHGQVLYKQFRDLVIKVDSERDVNDWKLKIDHVLQTAGQEWKQFNRFGSFYPVRSESYAKWFIHGGSLFHHCAEMLNMAEEEIFITDWWLTPEIFLRRPADIGNEWQLMEILKRKAGQGVRVYVMLYKELNIALHSGTAQEIQLGVMNVGSAHAKALLMSLDPKILVVRHPDTMPLPKPWTHHEKTVIVDQRVAFIGGIDLNFGRYDDYTHKLTDLGLHQCAVTETLPHELSPVVNVADYGRGKLDVPSNVVDGEDKIIQWFATDAGSIVRKTLNIGDRPTFEEVKIKYEEYMKSDKGKERLIHQDSPPAMRRRGRIKKSFDRWREKHMPRRESEPSEPDEVYEEYEEMIKRLGVDADGKLWIGKDYTNWYLADIIDVEHPYIDLIDRSQIPRVPWHDIASVVYGSAARDAARHFIQRWNQIKVTFFAPNRLCYRNNTYQTDKFNYDDKYPYLVPKSYDNIHIPKSWRMRSIPCSVQVIRSGALWSCGVNCVNESIHQAYIHIIQSAEHFIYIENQFFISLLQSSDVSNLVCQTLIQKIVKAHKERRKFRVYVVLPLTPAFSGELGTISGMNIQAVLYWTYKSILRGPNSLLNNLEKEIGDYSEYIRFFGLRTHAELSGKLVTEIVYVHSKVIVVDDKYAIIGSANLNDRSLRGDRDSEVCIYVEDSEFVDSTLNSKPYKSGRFAGTLRQRLISEHLGLLDEMGLMNASHKTNITDMVSGEVFDHVNRTARSNTEIYEKVFRCYPSDSIKTWDDLANCKKEKDNCLAISDKNRAIDMLSGIEGYLVEFPLQFLTDEDLNPPAYMYQNIGYYAVV